MAETFKVGANARELLRYTQRATRIVTDDISRSDARKIIQRAERTLRAAAPRELDIRGMETLEAESVVENYLDAASRSKLGTVTIIHGKGTGALRAAVHQLLKKNRQVKSFRLGRYGEGEAGVTVVELK